MRLAFWRDNAPAKTPEERFFDAIAELNDAWAELDANNRGKSPLRPWTDWTERRVLATAFRGQQIVYEDYEDFSGEGR